MITVSRKRTNYRGHAKCTKGNGLCSTSLSVVECWCVMSTPSLHCAFGTSPLGIDTPEYFVTEDRSQANRLAFDTSNLAFEIEQEIFFDKVK